MSENFEKFFLVVPPGFEDLALAELNLKMPGLEILHHEKGGLTIAAPLAVGLALNCILKIPVSVLLRIAEFKCRDLPKLYQKTSNIRWGRYLLGNRFELSVSSAKSRLLHEKKIAGSVAEGIARHFTKQPPRKLVGDELAAAPFEVMVRFFDDVCTFSLNTSGEGLFKRGYKGLSKVDEGAEIGDSTGVALSRSDSTAIASSRDGHSSSHGDNTAIAPLRENLAAGLFFCLAQELGAGSVTGDTSITSKGLRTLVDPMCGSGTFLYEARNFWSVASLANTGAGVALRTWAFAARAEWRKEVAAFLAAMSSEKISADGELKLYGFDRNEKVLRVLRENLLGLQVAVRDVFSDGEKLFAGGEVSDVVFICNPPYGVRLKLSEKPSVYYPKLLQKLLAYDPLGVGVILPKRFADLVPGRFGAYAVVRELSFENGGLPVVFRVYKR